MFKKILVATDGSEASAKTVDFAVDEAKNWKADLFIIYVIETGLFSSMPPDSTVELMYSMLEKEGQEALDYGEEKARAAGVHISAVILRGHAGSEILKFAQKEGVDMILLGSHGKSDVDRLLLGSVTDYVIRNSGVTTMVVRS